MTGTYSSPGSPLDVTVTAVGIEFYAIQFEGQPKPAATMAAGQLRQWLTDGGWTIRGAELEPEPEPAADDEPDEPNAPDLIGAYTRKKSRAVESATVRYVGDGVYAIATAASDTLSPAHVMRDFLKAEKWSKEQPAMTTNAAAATADYRYTVKTDDFRRIIAAAAHAATKTPKAGPMAADRPILTGIYLEMIGNTIIATAADGFRLCSADAPLRHGSKAPKEANIILRGDQLASFARSIKTTKTAGAGFVEIAPADSGPWTLTHVDGNGKRSPAATVETIDGTFPNYRLIIPDLSDVTGCSFEADRLLTALKPVMSPAEKKGTSVAFLYRDAAYPHRLSAVANIGAGYSRYVRWLDADAPYQSNDAEYLHAFDVTYLAAAAKLHAGDSATAYFAKTGDDSGPAGVIIGDAGRTRTVIMPVVANMKGEKNGGANGTAYGLTLHRQPPIADVTLEEAEALAAAAADDPNYDAETGSMRHDTGQYCECPECIGAAAAAAADAPADEPAPVSARAEIKARAKARGAKCATCDRRPRLGDSLMCAECHADAAAAADRGRAAIAADKARAADFTRAAQEEAAAERARQEEAKSSRRFCTNCGAPAEPADKFCGQCGTRLTSDEPTPPTTAGLQNYSGADLPSREELYGTTDAAPAPMCDRCGARPGVLSNDIDEGAHLCSPCRQERATRKTATDAAHDAVSAGAITPEEAAAIEEEQIEQRAEELTAAAIAAGPADAEEGDDYEPSFNIGAYSPRNQMRIYDQFPDAYEVHGFHQWIAVGRCVKKGEKGINIAAPIIVPAEASELSHAMAAFSGAALPEGPRKIVNVKPAYVFDWTQTRPLSDEERAKVRQRKEARKATGNRLPENARPAAMAPVPAVTPSNVTPFPAPAPAATVERGPIRANAATRDHYAAMAQPAAMPALRASDI